MLIYLQKISYFFWMKRITLVSIFFKALIRVIFSCHLPPNLKLSRSVRFGHSGLGVIINGRSEIGNNCFIGSHVVLGGQPDKDGAPTLESNVVVHSGAKIFGPIVIGEGSVVAAGAVVTKSVAPRSLVAGLPARVLRGDIDHRRFRPNAWKEFENSYE